MRIFVAVAVVLALFGQSAARKLTADEQAMLDEFTVPFPPFHFVGNIYYVGTKELSSFLIVTAAGNILLDSGRREAVRHTRLPQHG